VTKHIGNKNKGCFVKTLAGVTYGPWATKISIIFSSKQTLVQFISLSLSLSLSNWIPWGEQTKNIAANM
jgi:hypothetical protein